MNRPTWFDRLKYWGWLALALGFMLWRCLR